MSRGETIRWIAGDRAAFLEINRLRSSGAEPERLHTGPHRWVEAWADTPPEDAPIVLKWYAPRRPALRHLRDRLLGRTADTREWRTLVALEVAGLPVPPPLALGRTPSGHRVVAMRQVGEAPLLDRLRRASPEEGRALLASLAATVRRLHDAGFVHGDLHLGNLRTTGDAVHLLDLGRARRTASPRARDADRARLLYSVERDAGGPPARETLRIALGGDGRLDEARRRFLTDHARSRARRHHRPGADWQRLSAAPDWEGLATADLDAGILREALLEAPARRREAPRRGGRVTLEEIDAKGASDPSTWIRKRVLAGSGRRALADRLRGSPARRAFHRSERDHLISDRAARTLAFLERRAPGRVPESVLLLEQVGEFDLDAHRPASPEEARHLALALVDWLAEQHAIGLGHRDAKGGNIRVAREGRETPRFWWVDLEDLVGPVRLPESARLRALVQLNASLADEAFDAGARREALERYQARLPFSRPLDEIAREIHTKSLARNHRYRGEWDA